MEKVEYGYIFLQDEEAALKLGMHITTYKKYISSLTEKGYIDHLFVDGQEIKRFHLSGPNNDKN